MDHTYFLLLYFRRRQTTTPMVVRNSTMAITAVTTDIVIASGTIYSQLDTKVFIIYSLLVKQIIDILCYTFCKSCDYFPKELNKLDVEGVIYFIRLDFLRYS